MSSFADSDVAFIRKALGAGVGLDVIYDVGASNGYWSIMAHQAIGGGDYHLFEPLSDRPEYAQHLPGNVAALPSARLHTVALSDVTGVTSMSIAEDGFSSSLHDMSQVAGFGAAKPVRTYRLDDYVAEQGLPPPKLVKLDTQGTEHMIIAGAERTLASAELLMIETWIYRGYGPGTPLIGEIAGQLLPLGFSLAAFGDHFRQDDGRLYCLDAYFASGGALAKLKSAGALA